MTNKEKKPKNSQKIRTSEDFSKAMREEAEKLGISDKLIETPSESTNEYTVILRPFAKREKKSKS